MRIAILAGPAAAALLASSGLAQEHDQGIDGYGKLPGFSACSGYLDPNMDGKAAIAACDRLISSGAFAGNDLAALYLFKSSWYDQPVENRMEAVEKALALKPTGRLGLEARRMKGRYCSGLQRPQCAVEELEAAYSILTVEDNSLLAYNLVQSLGAAEAIKRYDQLVAAKPKSAGYLDVRGALHETAGNKTNAVADAEKAATMYPNVAWLQNVACWRNLTLLDRVAAARPYCEAADRLAPDNAMIQDSVGLYYLVTGDHSKALAAYDRALKAQPNYAHPQYGKALALDALGRSQESASLKAQAVAVDPALPQTYAGFAALKAGNGAAARIAAPAATAPRPASSTVSPNSRTASEVRAAIERMNPGGGRKNVGFGEVSVAADGDVMVITFYELENTLASQQVFETTRDNYCHDANYVRQGYKVRYVFMGRDGKDRRVEPAECLRLATTAEVEQRRAQQLQAQAAEREAALTESERAKRAAAERLSKMTEADVQRMTAARLGREVVVDATNSVPDGGEFPHWYHRIRIDARKGNQFRLVLNLAGANSDLISFSQPGTVPTGLPLVAIKEGYWQTGEYVSGGKVYVVTAPQDGTYVLQIKVEGFDYTCDFDDSLTSFLTPKNCRDVVEGPGRYTYRLTRQ